jgi:hypothetical protein
MFADFPLDVCRVVSKTHCIISAKREKKEVKVVPSSSKQQDIIIADTLCMNDLQVALAVKASKPRIMVNGELV